MAGIVLWRDVCPGCFGWVDRVWAETIDSLILGCRCDRAWELVPIDLNVLMSLVYESAALDLAMVSDRPKVNDYGQQPTPRLSQDDFDWVQKTIAG